MKKSDYFKEEIAYLKNNDYKTSLKTLIELLPDYFFEVPASSTLKYHPKYANTKHGLVKHTKVGAKIAMVLLDNNTIGSKFSEKEKDIIIMALVLHDGLKLGKKKSEFTVPAHPLLVSSMIMENAKKLKMEIDDIRLLCRSIESHMGEWNKDYFTKKEILPLPTTEIEKFIHMCDYLSSQKFLNVDFDNIKIEG